MRLIYNVKVLKKLVSVMSLDPLIKEGHTRFTTVSVPFNFCLSIMMECGGVWSVGVSVWVCV